MGGADEPADVVDRGGDRIALEVNVRAAGGRDVPAVGGEDLSEFGELVKGFGKDEVVDPVPVFHLSGGNDHYPGPVFGVIPPRRTPGRVEGITTPEDVEAFHSSGRKERLRRHRRGGGHRVRGVDMEVGVEKHGFPGDRLVLIRD